MLSLLTILANFDFVVASALPPLETIATIGNYDYMLDYVFHQDGSLEIAVRTFGYLQSSPYYANQSKWGPRIFTATQGSLHDHILTFKADFDIVSEKHSLQVSDLKAVKQSQPWFPEWANSVQWSLM